MLFVGLIVNWGCREMRWEGGEGDKMTEYKWKLPAGEVRSLLFSHPSSLAAISAQFYHIFTLKS